MSKTVDQRVVEMRFDNKQFEAGAQTSIDTLASLKKSLDLTGAAKSLEEVNATSKKMDFSHLSNAVSSIGERFSAMEVVAITALANITNSAVNAGKQMLYALTSAPVHEGFGEYELKMGSIQTIMAGTGESLETVNKYLDELNLYADRTIYSFSDMTSNIGKFTNAGVKLKDAVSAIQGISNLAAVSGANAENASHAMYNFAQALSTGYVQLIDWSSIKTANMDTMEFKNELIKTAVALGTLVEEEGKYVSTTVNNNGELSDAFDATTNFTGSLNHQWLTTEVLVQTLAKYSDETTALGKKAFAAAQDVKTFTQMMDTLKEAAGSGWATTWEIVFGNFEEAKKLWTNVGNTVGGVIDAISDKRNTLLKGWKELGGRADLIEAVKNAFNGLKSVVTAIGEVFREFFPAIQPQKLADLSKALKDLTAKFKMSKQTIENLKNTFRGLFAVIDIVRNLFGAIYRSIKPVISSIGSHSGGLIGKILNATGAFGKWLNSIKDIIKKYDAFYTAIQIAIKYIKKGIDYVKQFGEAIRKQLHLPEMTDVGQKFSDFVGYLKGKMQDFSKNSLSGFEELCARMSKALNKNVETKGIDTVNEKLANTETFMTKVSAAWENMKNGIVGFIKKIKNSISDAFDKINDYLSQSKLFQLLKALFDLLVKIGTAVARVMGDAIAELTDKISRLDIESILQFLNTLSLGGIMLGIQKLLKTMTGGVSSLSDILDGITGVLDGVKDCLKAYQTQLKANVLTKIAIAIAVLAASLLVLSALDADKLNASLGAVTVMFAELMGSFSIFSKKSGTMTSGNKAATALIAMSVAVLLLAAACRKMADLNPQQIGASVSGLIVLMYVLADFSQKLGKSGKLFASALGLIAIATAMKILVSACRDLSIMPWKGLAKGASGLSILLYVLADFTQKLGKSGKILSASIALIAIGAAMKILVSACRSLSIMPWKGLAKGLSGMVILLYVLADFTKKLGKSGKILAASIALNAIGSAMKILVSACKGLAVLSWEELGKGISGLTVLMYVLSDFTKKLGKSGKILAASIALIAIGAAMKILVSACKGLASLSWEELGKGVAGMTVLLYVLSDFTKKLGKSGKILSASIALIAIGAAMKILVSACKDLAQLSIEGLIKGLVGVGALLLEVALYAKMVNKSGNIIQSSIALMIIGAALNILASAAKSFAEMDWEGIGKSLLAIGVLLLEVGIFSKIVSTQKIVSVGVALIAMGAGLKIFASVCKTISSLSWEDIAKSLITIAGAFLIIGAAGSILQPIIPSILALAGALTLFGVGFVVIGGGLMLIGGGLMSISAGFTALTTALSVGATEITAALAVIVAGIANLIPLVCQKIGEGIIAICVAIYEGLPEISKVLRALVELLIDILVDYIPDLVKGVLESIEKILDTLLQYVPDIVSKLLVLLTNVLKELASKLPELIGAAVDVLLTFFSSVFDALTADNDKLIRALEGVGIIAAILAALAVLGTLAVPAMTGTLAVGAVIAELAALLAAIGLLEQIPGLNWLIGEGGKLLEAVGSAIGNFVGGIVGGAMESISNKLPKIGSRLSEFFKNAKPFIEGIGKFQASSLDGVKALAQVVVVLTATDVIDGLTSWFTGGSSLVNFGKELAAFGPSLSSYYESVKNVKGEVVTASANAALSLAALAKELPPHDGLLQWFFGQTTLTDFAVELNDFGPAMAKYSQAVENVKPEVVTASANAAMSLAKLAENLPKHDGLVQWITGDATLTTFAKEIEDFGPAIGKYCQAVAGVNPEVVTASANAALSLANLAGNLPSHDGVVQWFTGDATLKTFAAELQAFGPAIAFYSESIAGIDEEKITASANAASILSQAAANLPKHDGLEQVFTGDATLSSFAEELVAFGPAVAEYSDAVSGIDEQKVYASANAARILAKANANLPETGGLKQIWTGKKDMSAFAAQLPSLGNSIQEFSKTVEGITAKDIETAVYAIKILSEANENMPEVGGLKSLFSGEKSMLRFAEGVKDLGPAIKSFSDSIVDIDQEKVTSGANAAKLLSDVNKNLPETDGLKQIWTGKKDMLQFAQALIPLAMAVRNFGDRIQNVDTDLAGKAADFLGTLAEVNSALPDVGGIASWFSGNKQSLSDFGQSLAGLADGVALFYARLYEVDLDRFSKVVDSVVKLVELGLDLSEMDIDIFGAFGDSLSKMVTNGITSFSDAFDDAQGQIVQIAYRFVDRFTEALTATTHDNGDFYLAMWTLRNYMFDFLEDTKEDWKEQGSALITVFVNGMNNNVNDIQKAVERLIQRLQKTLKGAEPSLYSSGASLMTQFANGMRRRENEIHTLTGQIVTFWLIPPMKSRYSEMQSVGSYLMDGFAKGISQNGTAITKAAQDAANLAANAIKKTLQIKSPSKVGYELGDYFGMGFANALLDNGSTSFEAGGRMAESAKKGLSQAIAKVHDYIDGNVDTEITIRPVLDLSDVQSGVASMNGLLAERSVYMADLSDTSFRISAQGQKEIKINNDAVVQEVSALRSEVSSLKNVINSMRVVMDTGALVGSIAAPMNQALGRQAVYAGRRN